MKRRGFVASILGALLVVPSAVVIASEVKPAKAKASSKLPWSEWLAGAGPEVVMPRGDLRPISSIQFPFSDGKTPCKEIWIKVKA